MFPYVPLLMGVAMGTQAVSSIYGYRNASYSKRYYEALERENNRYWGDYARNTGVKNRYPYRTGQVFNRSPIMSAEASQWGALNSFSNAMLYSSLMPYAREYRNTWKNMYHPDKKKNFGLDPMYA